MTMGPAPMMRMLWMSVRLGMRLASAGALAQRLFREFQLRLQPAQHEVIEALEERLQIVRPGARLGVSLEAKRRPVVKSEALQRAVKERAVRGLHLLRQRRL